MRIRTIKPDFFKHDKVSDLKPLARLLFISLWCLADRRGRLEDRPKRIKVECLPYDDCDVDALLWELHSAGLSTVTRSKAYRSSRFHPSRSIREYRAKSLNRSQITLRSKREASGKRLVSSQNPRKGKERKGREEERKGMERARTTAFRSTRLTPRRRSARKP